MMSAAEIKKHAKSLGLTLVGDARKKGVKGQWLAQIDEALKDRDARKNEVKLLQREISLGHQFWIGDYEYFVHLGDVYQAHYTDVIECHTKKRGGRFVGSINHWNYYAKSRNHNPVLTLSAEFYTQANIWTVRALLTRSLLRYLHTKRSECVNLRIARDEVELMIAPNGEVNGDTLESINQACEVLVKFNLATQQNGFWLFTELGLKQASIFLHGSQPE